MLKLILLVLLVGLISCRMSIYSPMSLRKEFGNNSGNIPMSISNFGMIPYGHTVLGELKFLEDNDEGCSPFESTLKVEGEQSPIALVRRGSCSFVQKVRNVEHGGGKLAIVIDEEDNENPTMIIMVDDGTGNGIQIPSIMIGKTDGEKLITQLKELQEQNTPVKIIVSFDMNRPDDRVEYDIWFSSSNDRGLDFIRDFKEYHDKIGKKALVTPRYFSWACVNCDVSITNSDCFCDGKYCAIDETNLRVTGRDILSENLRQKCIYINSRKQLDSDEQWWNYVIKAHSRCYDDFSVDCSKQIHKELNIDYAKTEECVNSSFSDTDHGTGDNTIFSEEAVTWNNHGAHFIPSVIINSVAYRGTLDPENVFSAICNGFKDPQEECKGYVDVMERLVANSVTFNWFIVVIIFLILLNVALLLICKRLNKRSMKSEVNDAVNDYMKLRQSNVELSDKP